MIPSFIIKSLFFIPIILISLLTSYTDCKYGKIKNKHVVLSFLYVLFLYLLLFLYNYFFVHQPQNERYLLSLILNGLISFCLGYLLWYLNIWAAGDAKLFTIYACLIPLELYTSSYLPIFPSLTLLFITFLYISLFCFIQMIGVFLQETGRKIKQNSNNLGKNKRFCISKEKTYLLSKFNIILVQLKNFCLMFVGYFIPVQYLRNYLMTNFHLNSNMFGLLFFICQVFLLRFLLRTKIIWRSTILIGIIFTAFIIVSSNITILIKICRQSLPFMIITMIILEMLNFYTEHFRIQKVSINNLKIGDFLTPNSCAVLVQKISDLSQKTKFEAQLSFSDGLDKQTIQFIQKIFNSTPNLDIYIYRTLPFAPFLFLSFLTITFSTYTKFSLFSILLSF